MAGAAATPPGVSEAVFADALNRFAGVVGAENVYSEEEDVALYRDAYSPLWDEREEKLASAAVAPASAEEVQAVARIANELRIPLYPVSTGRNLGYGGSAPVLSGSVVLDLKRMNRILDISERDATVLVEPGVSYFDLYRHIVDNGLKLWIDCPDPGWGSVIGNAMDRGGGVTTGAYRDHFGSHCGMEVVLADGDIIRTGMGAMPGANTWQQNRYGYGPWVDGIFSQSNYGIVTKMGFWLMPAPDAYLSGTIAAHRHQDVIPLIDVMNRLENIGAFTGYPQVGSPVLFQAGAGAAPEELEAQARASGQPVWTCRLQFYGGRKVNEAQWEYCQEQFAAAIPGATFQRGEEYDLPLTPEQAEALGTEKVSFGIPNLGRFSIGARSEFNDMPTSGHVWFSPILPRTGEGLLAAQKVLFEAAEQLKPYNLSVLPMPFANWQRTFIFLINFPIYRDKDANRQTREAFRKLVKICAENGLGEYRTAPAFMNDVGDTYSFNDHALRRFHERLKDAVDPNGILSAGRYGVWPRHLRT